MEMSYKAKSLYERIVQALLKTEKKKLMPKNEAQQVAMLLLDHYLHMSWNDILLDKEIIVEQVVAEKIKKAVERVLREEPVQYILEEAHFYGRKFLVSKGVLIPRRETEELMHLVVKENSKSGLRILDIGTGSGCIAITLKKELQDAEVHALDISQQAIEITRKNARLHKVEINIHRVDIMEESSLPNLTAFDIVVSNPPYVRKSETTQMENNVLKYEPHLALFVEDARPLLFYEQIVELCIRKKILKQGGHLYFEINEVMGAQTASLLQKKGFENVKIIQDMQRKDRFVKGTLLL